MLKRQMRPVILDALFSDITTVKGIGPRYGIVFEGFIGRRLIDALFHLPYQLIDRRYRPTLSQALDGRITTTVVTIGAHEPPRHRNGPYKINCYDDTGELQLIFFRARGDWLAKSTPEGSQRLISGRLERFRDRLQMVHPDHIVALEKAESVPLLEPVYPLTAGLTAPLIRKACLGALLTAPKLPEWQDESWLASQNWPSWHDALYRLHYPEVEEDVSIQNPARERLAYDELLANQITLSLVRQNRQVVPGQVIKGTGVLQEKFLARLPFALTQGQQQAISEIKIDLEQDKRMLRLVQGDVGSGKTFVALMAMLQTVEAGKQATLMAPTEILARQHGQSIGAHLEALGIGFCVLTSRIKGKAREKMLADIASGEIQIIIGTHAVFQESVDFHNLGLAIVDEQHRFGVKQRLQLGDKGKGGGLGTNILVMTATPIPRTLTLTAYGDMDVSRITDKPAGRQPIDTRLMSIDRYQELKAGLARIIAKGERAYWVCPLVNESDLIDLAAAEARYADLRDTYGNQIGLVHGQMKAQDKDKIMESFALGEISVLIATTVIEVGVDVPEATTIVIEHAERFGLAQLHQLRGRVGRGDKKSNCILLYRGPLGETSRARLEIMRESQDGFEIAEKDLELRGSGEVLGVRQSGLPQFKVANLDAHAHLMPIVHDDARLILTKDPKLTSARGIALRDLLHIFERNEALRFLGAG